jgi:hypothetical protein
MIGLFIYHLRQERLTCNHIIFHFMRKVFFISNILLNNNLKIID